MMGPTVRALAAVLAGILLVAGCSSEPPPGEQLSEAAAATFDAPFEFSLSVRPDEATLTTLEETLGPVGRLIDDAEVSGRIGAGESEVLVDVLGVRALQARTTGPGSTFVRLRLGQFLGLAQEAQAQELLDGLAARLQGAGVGEAATQAVLAGVSGTWVRVETGSQEGSAAGGSEADAGGDPSGSGSGEVGGSLIELLDAAEVDELAGADEEGPRQFGVVFELRQASQAISGLLNQLDGSGALGRLPATLAAGLDQEGADLTGDVVVSDGRVTQIALDLGAALRELTDFRGEVRISLDIGGEPQGSLLAPDDAVSVPPEELAQALAALGATAPGTGGTTSEQPSAPASADPGADGG